jgi:hypothetical protein
MVGACIDRFAAAAGGQQHDGRAEDGQAQQACIALRDGGGRQQHDTPSTRCCGITDRLGDVRPLLCSGRQLGDERIDEGSMWRGEAAGIKSAGVGRRCLRVVAPAHLWLRHRHSRD